MEIKEKLLCLIYLKLVEKSFEKIYNIHNVGTGGIMNTKEKKWILILLIIAGIVIGGLIGDVSNNSWLNYGQKFGLTNPVQIDFNILSITFGFLININVASIIGILLAILIYLKIK